VSSFQIKTSSGQTIRFNYYKDAAPQTCAAFEETLPFSKLFYHARVSGFEIWIDNAPQLNIPQENASVFAQAGEIVIAPMQPSRNKIIGCIGIFYGEGKLVDCGNIFGKVFDEDLPILKTLGDEIWRKGAQELVFQKQ
jgi:uncharacterized protein DUF3830